MYVCMYTAIMSLKSVIQSIKSLMSVIKSNAHVRRHGRQGAGSNGKAVVARGQGRAHCASAARGGGGAWE